jgi:hypothetical protein
MENELKSEGKCWSCSQLFSQKEISKHLSGHLLKIEKEASTQSPEVYCHIVVEADLMFLHLLVKGNATMEKIDTFLREIWMECCGHLSEFRNKNVEIEMSQKVKSIFGAKVKFLYAYDFGSTTTVTLKGVKNYNIENNEDIILLSRNEPLEITCSGCGKKPVVDICIACHYKFYCKSCSAKHKKECEDFKDYAKMPVVNSPRMGVCGYTGGSIDTERDGISK